MILVHRCHTHIFSLLCGTPQSLDRPPDAPGTVGLRMVLPRCHAHHLRSEQPCRLNMRFKLCLFTVTRSFVGMGQIGIGVENRHPNAFLFYPAPDIAQVYGVEGFKEENTEINAIEPE